MIFRYPGGKTKLVPKFIEHIPNPLDNFADVFVGGGSVALAVAKRDSTTQIYLNDNDFWIASFWTIVSGDQDTFDSLIRKIESTKCNIETFHSLRAEFQPEKFEQRRSAAPLGGAFCALFFNRTTFSGCLSSGPIGGDDQKGDWKVDARWNSSTLVKDIKTARNLLIGRTKVSCLDFSDAIKGLPSNCFLYLDPPYIRKGETLYGSSFTKEKHEELRRILGGRPNWLLSYDNYDETKTMYAGFRQQSLGKVYRSMGNKQTVAGVERPQDDSELIIFSKEGKMKRCDRHDPHPAHDGCMGREKWEKGFGKSKNTAPTVPAAEPISGHELTPFRQAVAAEKLRLKTEYEKAIAKLDAVVSA